VPPPAPTEVGPGPAPTEFVDDPAAVTIGRHERRLRRRRLVREQVAILIVLMVALAVTVALLAGQWLLNPSVTGTVTLIPFSAHLFTG
jgi:hypothetical protein